MEIKTMEKNNMWRCKDLYLAAFVYSQGKDVIKLERDGKVCWFIFDDPTRCETFKNDFWMNSGSVAPKVYAEAIRSLKDLIFAS